MMEPGETMRKIRRPAPLPDAAGRCGQTATVVLMGLLGYSFIKLGHLYCLVLLMPAAIPSWVRRKQLVEYPSC
jgi:hypothetical protein